MIQNALRIDLDELGRGRHHRPFEAESLDESPGPLTRPHAWQFAPPIEQRRFHKTRAAEIDGASALRLRFVRARRELRHPAVRSITPKPENAEIDQFDLLPAGIIVAKRLEMRGIEGARSMPVRNEGITGPPGRG